MNAWQEYKKKVGTVKPWHMLDSQQPRVDDGSAQGRLDVCVECPELIALTKQCKQCGCFMNLKVKLEAATCPLGKW